MQLALETFVSRYMDRPEAPHQTDLARWKLDVCEGRQVWRYLGDSDQAVTELQTVVDKYFLGLDTVRQIHQLFTQINPASSLTSFLRRRLPKMLRRPRKRLL